MYYLQCGVQRRGRETNLNDTLHASLGFSGCILEGVALQFSGIVLLQITPFSELPIYSRIIWGIDSDCSVCLCYQLILCDASMYG
jgi:hypothetical protein